MITEKELRKLQKLAKITFTEEEGNIFLTKLNNVIEMIDKLSEIQCEKVEPLRSVCDMFQRMRKDEAITSDISNELFANVPVKNAEFAREVKCFVVPKVVE